LKCPVYLYERDYLNSRKEESVYTTSELLELMQTKLSACRFCASSSCYLCWFKAKQVTPEDGTTGQCHHVKDTL
jgi:hypothetical protein